MNGFNILIISPEPWNGHFVSKHHYAITLVQKGYKVYFLNPPTKLKKIKILETKYQNLYQIESAPVFKGLRFLPKILRVYLEGQWLKNLEKLIESKMDTIWIFENSRFYNMEFAKDRLKIYHQVDSNQNFHIKEASSSADICFCVTDYIKRDLLIYNKKVFKISHGLNISKEKLALSLEQLDYFNKSTINITYIGNIDIIYINEKILYSLVLSYPDITFHLIGNYSKDGVLYKLCKDMKNIVWWGRVESKLISTILEKIDISLLIYRVEEYQKQLANSHKILEYLYSGKVTIATYTDEYKDKRELLEMVDSSDNYEKKFEEVLHNLKFYNSKEKQEERVAFAEENSYRKQLEKITFLLKKETS